MAACMHLGHSQRIGKAWRAGPLSRYRLQEMPGFDDFHIFVTQAAAIARIKVAMEGVSVAAHQPDITIVAPNRHRASKAPAHSCARNPS